MTPGQQPTLCASAAIVHPLVKRFLDFDVTLNALFGEAFNDADVTALQRALSDRTDETISRLRASKGLSKRSEFVEAEHLMLLSDAALYRLEADPQWADALAVPTAKLAASEATDEQARNLLLGCVVEECFGEGSDVDHFDAAWLRESFVTLGHLLDVTPEWVEAFQDEHSSGLEGARRDLARRATTALFNATWNEGIEAFTPAAVEEAWRSLLKRRDVDPGLARVELLRLLEALRQRGLVGPLRYARLTSAVHAPD